MLLSWRYLLAMSLCTQSHESLRRQVRASGDKCDSISNDSTIQNYLHKANLVPLTVVDLSPMACVARATRRKAYRPVAHTHNSETCHPFYRTSKNLTL